MPEDLENRLTEEGPRDHKRASVGQRNEVGASPDSESAHDDGHTPNVLLAVALAVLSPLR
jgi:hypothetical protein